ncbi:MAG: ATP-binding protein [Verrucomicrobiota bacterium]
MSDSPLVQQPFAVWIQTAACDLISVREASQKVCAFLGRQGLQPDEISAWELLCAEAGNNAVLHVQPGAEQKPVVFLVLVFPDLVEIQVVDHTAGFDFPEKPELPDPTSEHGRGLFLMRTLSDQAEYLRGREENRLVLIRKRAHPVAPPVPGPNVEAEQAESMLQTMSEELSACYESLSAIFRFTEEINKGGQDARFIARWLDELRTVCAADWWILRLAAPGGNSLVQFASSRHELLPPVSLVPGRQESIEGSAATGRQDVWLEPDVQLPARDPLRAFGQATAGLSHPIHVNGTLLGVMTLGRAVPNVPFTAGQVSIIHTFADFLGLQIHNSRILEEQLQSRLLSRDLEIAASIQRSLLPVDLPAPRGFRLSGHSASASQVGGDFYDVLEIPEVGLLFAIADVMGKGVPAAMLRRCSAAIFGPDRNWPPDPLNFSRG